jgi:hypothetical protein
MNTDLEDQMIESDMTVRRTTLADGRYLIYFEFDGDEQQTADEQPVEREDV